MLHTDDTGGSCRCRKHNYTCRYTLESNLTLAKKTSPCLALAKKTVAEMTLAKKTVVETTLAKKTL